MKNIITIIFITLMTYSLYAQVPGIGQVPFGIKYQAVARDGQGQPMNSEDITLRFTILSGSSSGTEVFTELQPATTNDLGLFNIVIGSENSDDFQNIDWRTTDHFLKVELITQGNSIELGMPQQILSVPYAVTAGNGKMKSTDNQDEFLRFYGTNDSENIVIGGNGTNGDFNNGLINLIDENGDWKVTIRSNHIANAGDFVLRGRNNNNNLVMGPVDATNNADFGVLRIHDDEGAQRITAFSAPGRNGAGLIDVRGENNNFNVGIGNQGDNNHGAIRIYDDENQNRGEIISAPSREGAGFIKAFGANGSRNVELSPTGNNNRGQVCIFDENNASQVCLFIDGNGNGVVAKDVNSFFMDHPRNPEKEIWYASIEGPEAAAYERGTAQLVNGEARVDFSEHFELVVNPETVTFVLTPRSAASKGLAAVEQTATGFTVKELLGGTGSYDFDWRVEGVRKGYEDFEVIRDKKEMDRMLGIDPEEK